MTVFKRLWTTTLLTLRIKQPMTATWPCAKPNKLNLDFLKAFGLENFDLAQWHFLALLDDFGLVK